MRIVIEDSAMPSLFTSAIEAYDFEHKTNIKGKGKSKLETYGLLWGYMIPSKSKNDDSKIIVSSVTIETSALRHEDWVHPNGDSIAAKKELIERYWPHVELVGTFHSHPYRSIEQVNVNKGWIASPEDKVHWCELHRIICESQPSLAHLIITVTELTKKGWAYPNQISGQDFDGYVFSAGKKKIWITSYASQKIHEDKVTNEPFEMMHSGLRLDVPSLVKRMYEYN